MIYEKSDQALIEGGHRAEESTHNVKAFFKEKIVGLAGLVQLVDRIYEKAPSEVIGPYVGQDFAEGATWHTMNFIVSQQVEDAVEQDTFEFEGQVMFMRVNNLADEVKLAPCFILLVPVFYRLLQVSCHIICVCAPKSIFAWVFNVRFELVSQTLVFLKIHGIPEIDLLSRL